MIDGKSDTFWLTTGLFPQKAIISLKESAQVQGIRIKSKYVKSITVSYCNTARPDPNEFKTMFGGKLDVEAAPADFQVTTLGGDGVVSAKFLAIQLEAGYSDYAAIYQVQVDTA
jgi:heat shock protein beta-11